MTLDRILSNLFLCTLFLSSFGSLSTLAQEPASHTVDKSPQAILAQSKNDHSDPESGPSAGSAASFHKVENTTPDTTTTSDKDPIDKQEEECLSKASSTAAMIDCEDVTYKAWDKELNKVYSQLIKELPADSRQLLKDSQLEWIQYRDKEFKAIDSIYSHVMGSMYLPICAENHVNIVKDRVLQLRRYLNLPVDEQ